MIRVRHSGLPPDFIATDPEMARVVAFCRKVARQPHPVLLEGEAGSGKTRLARLLHALSDRAPRPFVVLNCAATSWERLESTLFGIERPDAPRQPGKLDEARGGTLLIKAIGDLPPAPQRRLLAFLQTGDVAVAGRREHFDVRILATSEQRLLNLARAGDLDEQLFYRLNVLPVTLPPLRARLADIGALAERFAAEIAAETGRAVEGLSEAALLLLARHDWPGNVRELENAVYRAVALARSRRLEPADFPHLVAAVVGRDAAAGQATPPASAPVHIDMPKPARQAEAALDRFLTPEGEIMPLAGLERELIAFALEHHQGRMSRIARALGIGRSTLYRKLRDYGLDGAVGADPA